MATSKSDLPLKVVRTVTLKRRPATISNLNFQPEKAGQDTLVERVDLSLKFIVKDMDVDELVNTKGNPLLLLWHSDGGVQFRELKALNLNLEAEGTLDIGIDDEHMLTFENAKLKKVFVVPYVDRQCEVKCQVRIDPTGHMETLGQIRIHEDCVFAFAGSGVDKSKNKDQGELEV